MPLCPFYFSCVRGGTMTLAEKAYLALRHDIVRGTWTPKQPLKMSALSKCYDMGFSPLREALSRLQSDGLVTLAPLRGFTVAPLSLDEMWDTINLRILIEIEAFRLSIRNGNDEWEAGVVASLHALTLQSQRASSDDDDALWELERRHHVFHRQLISACDSPRMIDYFERLYVDTERYRIPLLLIGGGKTKRNIQAEHSRIAEAAIARKTEAACKLLAEHYRLTAETIERQATGTSGQGGLPAKLAKPRALNNSVTKTRP
jgi:GntR family transcriptional regulator, carbon starvation induced regulator